MSVNCGVLCSQCDYKPLKACYRLLFAIQGKCTGCRQRSRQGCRLRKYLRNEKQEASNE